MILVKICRALSLVLLSVVISSCQLHSEIDREFLQMLHLSDVKDVNRSLSIDFSKSETIDDGLYVFRVSNLSDYDITMPPDFNVRIFVLDKEKSKWVEIKNNIKYDDDIRILSQELKKLPSPLAINPIVPFSSDPQKLRIVIFGNIISNGKVTDQIVVAYTEIVYPI